MVHHERKLGTRNGQAIRTKLYSRKCLGSSSSGGNKELCFLECPSFTTVGGPSRYGCLKGLMAPVEQELVAVMSGESDGSAMSRMEVA